MLQIDADRGREVARLLHSNFSTTGIFGNTVMPEDILPAGLKRGSLAHLLFITLTVSIDYQRDANVLWAVARKTYEDRKTRYLFDPESLHITKPKLISEDMQKYGLSKKPAKDSHIWRTIGVTFFKKWKGNPLNFLNNYGWDSIEILKRLKADTHIYNKRPVPDYPYLRGDKIGPLWLRMLRDNVGIDSLINLNKVPIPVDIHVARATLAIGVVHGSYTGKLPDLFSHVRMAWFEGVIGLDIKNRPMIALDVDEPLWHLSKYGCTHRNKETGHCPKISECVAKKFCMNGRVKIEKNDVELCT